MGFTMQLLTLYPQHLSSTCTVWVAQETLFLGRVTRLEKLTDSVRFGHIDFEPHWRAGICVSSCLLGKALSKLGETKPVGIAPPFVTYYQWQERQDLVLTYAESIDPGYDADGYREPGDGRPRFENLHEHNRIIQLDDEQLQKHLDATHVILHGPLLWDSCTEIASFLDEAEVKKSDEWRELAKDPIALAVACAWREYIREIGKIGARALYVFP